MLHTIFSVLVFLGWSLAPLALPLYILYRWPKKPLPKDYPGKDSWWFD